MQKSFLTKNCFQMMSLHKHLVHLKLEFTQAYKTQQIL